jgi:molecular chaperone GrpE
MSSQDSSLPTEDAVPAGDMGTTGSAAEAPASVDEQLKQALIKAEEHRDAWIRAKAETENVRKRGQLDVQAAHKFAVEDLAERLLPVRDGLEAALTAPNPSAETLRTGAELTLKQLNAVFDKAKLVEINPAGEKFDPHMHQAIGMVEAEGEPNRVVAVLQKGYRLHDRVVRPALVTVSKAPGG